jgi:hypothetical protein
MPTKEITWGEAQAELLATPAVSKEEMAVVQEKIEALDKLLGDKKLAKYKLEVMFGEGRSMHKPFGGTVTWWESGSKLHGGGDNKLYVCPGKERANNGCEALLPDTTTGLNLILCPKCQSLWKAEEVWGEVFYRLPIQTWADVLLSWFLKLGLNADIRIKYARDDIRGAAFKEQEKKMQGELLTKARSFDRRSTSIYSLANIIKDTSAGAGLHSRILAFLKA